MKILLAEDDRSLGEFVAEGLRAEGFAVDHVCDGTEALSLATTQAYDAVLLDIMLPGRDGLGILKLMRSRQITTPVIVLTARGEVEERIEGLNLGADDYLAKPFYLEELVARLRSVWRRASGSGLSILAVGDLRANLMTREVDRGGRKIDLSPQELSLLTFLMRHPGRIRTRPQILDQVWDYQFNPGTNLVEVYVRKLRSKIEEPGKPPLIETLRGVGYRMRNPEP